MKSLPSNLKKTYPKRGPLSQFRFADAIAFMCFRCGTAKKSKLITIYDSNWSRQLCNGCYGRLLSLHQIKTGTKTVDERVEELAAALISAVDLDERRQAERVFQTAEQRAKLLSRKAVRFIATAEYVSGQLQSEPQLEWSPAVIGLCQAVEAEIVIRILNPLADKLLGSDLNVDETDKDIGCVAKFCADKNPPSLGKFSHFLQTVIHSQQRRNTSTVIRNFLRLARDWPGSNWILEPDSFHSSLGTLIKKFRNRAAHIDELGRDDFINCRDLVIGNQGVIWNLLISTERHR